MILGDEADAALPARRGVVEYVNELELFLMHICELLEVILEQDIRLVDIGVDKGDRGAVEGVFEGGADNLDHGSDTRTTSDHAEVADNVGSVEEVALGTLDAHSVADLELRDVFGDIAEVVCLQTRVLETRKAVRRLKVK